MRNIMRPLLIILLFAACERRQEPVREAVREDLFTLEIGRMEDQIALYNLEGQGGVRRGNMAMRDGLFYISDGMGGKILRYNAYGELLFMIYNEETNPSPMSLKPLQDNNLVTRWAVSYPLNEPGEIAVDSRKHIYVRDLLPYDKHSFDPESKALLSNVILHFDENGRFVEYLGRNGIGGAPFPWVEGIFTSVQDEFAVVCRLPTGWEIYWFRSDGAFLYMVQLKNNAVPVPAGMRGALIASLDSIAAAPDARHLYVKVDYYQEIFDEANMPAGNEYDFSAVWIMNVEDGSWKEFIELPSFESAFMENNRSISFSLPYSLSGVIRGGGLLLFFPVEGGYSLLFLVPDADGRMEQKQCFIHISNEEFQYNAFNLSVEGILSGLLLDDWEVKLVWWRTDLFIGEEAS